MLEGVLMMNLSSVLCKLWKAVSSGFCCVSIIMLIIVSFFRNGRCYDEFLGFLST
jgi:hypothetical protein